MQRRLLCLCLLLASATFYESHAFHVEDDHADDHDGAPLLDESKLRRLPLMPDGVADQLTDASPETVLIWAAGALGLSATELELREDKLEPHGQRHFRFQQVVKFTGGQAAEVLGGDFIVHIDTATQKVYAVTGTVVEGTSSVQPPTLSRAAAQAAAVANVRSRVAGFDPAKDAAGLPQLQVVPSIDGLVVVWCSENTATRPVQGRRPALIRVCSSAHGRGSILESRNVLQTATVTGTGRSYYSGTVNITTNSLSTTKYEMRDNLSYGHYTMSPISGRNTILTDADNKWGNGTTADRHTSGVDVHFGAAISMAYWKNVHGRNGIYNDNRGGYSIANYGTNYNGAFWQNSCRCMTYGNGDNIKFFPFTAIDVCGHEMTHGVTAAVAGLVYSGESGGLNEAMSDIFGTMTEFYANHPLDPPDYTIGERIYKDGTPARRYLYNPPLDGKSAGCYNASIGTLDVHYSSGVANHWFYLLAEGSAPGPAPKIATGSPTCDGSTIDGIGRDKAALLLFRALDIYMTTSTNYKGARTTTIQAANDLLAQGKLTATDVAQVSAAWTAVSVLP